MEQPTPEMLEELDITFDEMMLFVEVIEAFEKLLASIPEETREMNMLRLQRNCLVFAQNPYVVKLLEHGLNKKFMEVTKMTKEQIALRNPEEAPQDE